MNVLSQMFDIKNGLFLCCTGKEKNNSCLLETLFLYFHVNTVAFVLEMFAWKLESFFFFCKGTQVTLQWTWQINKESGVSGNISFNSIKVLFKEDLHGPGFSYFILLSYPMYNMICFLFNVQHDMLLYSEEKRFNVTQKEVVFQGGVTCNFTTPNSLRKRSL